MSGLIEEVPGAVRSPVVGRVEGYRPKMEPASVSADELGRLCQDPRGNRDHIAALLQDLAPIVVAKEIKGEAPADELAGAILDAMLKAIPKFDPEKGGAFNFFYTVAIRAGWYAAAKWSKQPAPTRKAAVGEVSGGRTRGSQRITRIRAAEPVRHGRKRKTPRPWLDLLDLSIRKARKAIRTFEESDPEFLVIEGGIRFLQAHRFEVTGAYLPMNTPTIRYSNRHLLAQEAD